MAPASQASSCVVAADLQPPLVCCRTCMIPFVKEMVPLVDKEARRILVSPPEGLLELTSVKAIKV